MPTAPETFILIPGRTSRQGTTLNEGKLTAAYVEETSTLLMCPDDMTRLGLANTGYRCGPSRGGSSCPARRPRRASCRRESCSCRTATCRAG
jgi:hypothetical protein